MRWDWIQIEISYNLDISILNGCEGPGSEQIFELGSHLRIQLKILMTWQGADRTGYRRCVHTSNALFNYSLATMLPISQ